MHVPFAWRCYFFCYLNECAFYHPFHFSIYHYNLHHIEYENIIVSDSIKPKLNDEVQSPKQVFNKHLLH